MSDPNAAYTSEEARIRDIKYSYNNVYDYKNVGITTYVCAHKKVSMIYNTTMRVYYYKNVGMNTLGQFIWLQNY